MSRRLLYLNLETMDPDRAAHTHVTGIIGALERQGWTVTLIARQAERARGTGIGRQCARYLALNLAAIRALPATDAVYCRAHFAALPLALAAHFVGRPVCHEINGVPDDIVVTYPSMAPVMGLIRRCYRWQYRLAAHLFPITSGLADFARSFAGHGRITVTPNGVDLARFDAAPIARPADVPAGRYALFYGDLARWHGLNLMLEAARSSNWPQDLALLLIGRGTAAERVDIPADLAGRVFWLDRKPQQALPAYIAHAAAGLVPITDPGGRSSTGVLPLKLIEMLAGRLPVAVTDFPGQADLVRGAGCGSVAARDDAQGFAAAVADAARDDLRSARGERGRATVEAGYTWDAIARTIAAKLLAD